MCDPPKLFGRQCNLKRHLNLHRGGFQCSQCSKKFDRKERLEVHILKHTRGTKPFLCKTCNKSFTRKESLIKHQWMTHDVKPVEFSCNLCNATFPKRSERREHLANAHPDGTFRCTENNCLAQFKKSSSYHAHIDFCRSSNPKFKCEFPGCNKVFNNKGLLEQHKSKHEDPRLICDHCGNKFRWLSSYKAHLNAVKKKKDSLKSKDRKETPAVTGANVTEPRLIVSISPKSQEHPGYTYMQPFTIMPQNEQEADPNMLSDESFWPAPVDMHVGTPGDEMVPNQELSVEMSIGSRDGLGQFLPTFNPNLQR